jgi:hypothetical protein
MDETWVQLFELIKMRPGLSKVVKAHVTDTLAVEKLREELVFLLFGKFFLQYLFSFLQSVFMKNYI